MTRVAQLLRSLAAMLAWSASTWTAAPAQACTACADCAGLSGGWRAMCENDCRNRCAAQAERDAAARPQTTGPGPYLGPLTSGSFDAFSALPAYRIRLYAGTAIATLRVECPALNVAAPPPIAHDAALYLVEGTGQTHNSVGVALFGLGNAVSDAAFAAQADSERDVRWSVGANGCSAVTHRGLATNAHKLLADPAWAGPMSLAQKACELHGAGIECGCFARSFDMQASPRRRQMLASIADPLAAAQSAMRDRDFAIATAARCDAVPNFFRPELIMPAGPDPQAAPTTIVGEGRYRLRGETEGGRIFYGSCVVTRTAPNRWRLEYSTDRGGRMSGVGFVDGGVLKVWRGETDPMAYRIGADGVLTASLQGREPEVLRPYTDPILQPRQPRAAPPATPVDRVAAARERFCRDVDAQIERIRQGPAAGTPAATRRAEQLEQQQALHCRR